MKHIPSRALLHACSLITLCAAPLWAGAQTPPAKAPTPPSAPPPAPAQAAAAAQAPAAAATPAVPSNQEGSYLIGVNFGQQLRQIGIGNEVTVDEIARGMKEALAGKKLDMNDQLKAQVFVRSLVDAAVARNKAAAKEFLARNGKEKGVKTTSSGLQYKVIAAGDGKAASPSATDQVVVQYRGKLLDGSEFDSSYSRGTPATFPVSGVIKGWSEAMQLMKPGAKWQLWVPPELGYDASPRPGIPAGSLLAFEVELVSIKPAAAQTPPAVPPAMTAPAPAKTSP